MPTILENKIIAFNSKYGTKLTIAKLDNSARERLDNINSKIKLLIDFTLAL